MTKKNNSQLTDRAQRLRRNMTKEEKHLWYDFLKDFPVTVHRQRVIGKYIVDFYIASKKIAIELDGSQHYEKQGMEYDISRDEYLKNRGIEVLRYSNLDIARNFDTVCKDIWMHMGYVL